MEDENVKSELRDYDPFLSEYSGKNHLKVPEGYFEKMQAEVMHKAADVHLEKPSGLRVIWKKSRYKLKPLVATAAAIALFVVFRSGMFSGQAEEFSLAEQETEVLVHYFEELSDGEDLYKLIEVGLLNEGDLESIFEEIEFDDTFLDEFLYDEENLKGVLDII